VLQRLELEQHAPADHLVERSAGEQGRATRVTGKTRRA